MNNGAEVEQGVGLNREKGVSDVGGEGLCESEMERDPI